MGSPKEHPTLKTLYFKTVYQQHCVQLFCYWPYSVFTMSNLVNSVKSQALKVAENFVPILKESKFKETGRLTPDEFVTAGDHMVHHCPTWQWSGGEATKAKDYLPKDKQFLITRNVPCYKRVKQVDTHNNDQEKVVEEDEDGGWVDTHHFSITEDSETSEMVADMRLTEDDPEAVECDEESDEEVGDMEEFMENDQVVEIEDVAAAKLTSGVSELVQTRTYDLYITYDKYYQTPRLWFTGYDESRKALSDKLMDDDISQDHANKTVTMETHPHITAASMASVHPCRHAEVMKKIIQTVAEGGNTLGVHMYLVIFLKFVQAIIPTIEYDFTRNFVM